MHQFNPDELRCDPFQCDAFCSFASAGLFQPQGNEFKVVPEKMDKISIHKTMTYQYITYQWSKKACYRVSLLDLLNLGFVSTIKPFIE